MTHKPTSVSPACTSEKTIQRLERRLSRQNDILAVQSALLTHNNDGISMLSNEVARLNRLSRQQNKVIDTLLSRLKGLEDHLREVDSYLSAPC